jgi:hypothetical protein
MNAASLGGLWAHIAYSGQAFRDEESEIKGQTLNGMVAIRDVDRRPVFLYR